MNTASLAKKNFDDGYWTSEMLAKLVERGKLTQEQYKEITGAVVEDGTRYFLNTTGSTYHTTDCTRAIAGSLKTLAQIAAASPEAQPCAVCNPPALGGAK